MDLKRFVLGMVTNQFGLPLFAKAYSGNKSDKKSIMEMIQKTQQAIDFDDKSYWIADSALYTEENIKLLGTETKWITHPSHCIRSSKATQLQLKYEDFPGLNQSNSGLKWDGLMAHPLSRAILELRAT